MCDVIVVLGAVSDGAVRPVDDSAIRYECDGLRRIDFYSSDPLK